MSNLISLIIVGLFVSRVSRLLVKEDAPYRIARRFRELFGLHIDKQFEYFDSGEVEEEEIVVVKNKSPLFRTYADALQCTKCTSVWVAAVASAVFLPADPKSWLLQTFALSAISIIVDGYL